MYISYCQRLCTRALYEGFNCLAFSFQLLLVLHLYELTETLAHWTHLRGFAWKFLTFKAQVTPFLKAQLAVAQNLFSFEAQQTSPLGHLPVTIREHFSQANPQNQYFV